MENLVKELCEADFSAAVLEREGLSLVEFGAPWCPPCKALIPTLHELAGQYERNLKVFTVNTDQSPELAVRYKIRGLPTVILFKQGVVVEELYGKQGISKYQVVINRELAEKAG